MQVCREANISKVTFHRWKNQLGQMKVSDAKRLKQLERENTELKKILAESLRKNRVPEAGVRQKVISPEQRRRAARAVVAGQLCSGRAACRFLKVSRSTYSYRSKEPTSQEQRLLKLLMELSDKHGRYGYRRIAALLRQEGWPVGKRHVQRLRRSLGLRVPPTKRNREQLWTLTEARVVIIPLAIRPSPAAQRAGLPKPKNASRPRPNALRLRLQSLRAPYAADGQTKANNITNN